MSELRVAHTSDLGAATLDAVRELLEDAFAGDFSDSDWEHALGGVHALVHEGDDLIGHGSVVRRRLLHGGRALRAGYVEGVAVRADRRGRGHGAALMAELERVIRAAYDVGALGTTEQAAEFYARRGWRRWKGPTLALTPRGVVRTPDDDGSVYVLPVVVSLDVGDELTCDWRDGDVW